MKSGWIYSGNQDTQEKFAPVTTINQILSAENGIPFSEYLQQSILNTVFPIGTIYLSLQSASPSESIGGVWASLGSKLLIGSAESTESIVHIPAAEGIECEAVYMWKRIA